MYNNFGDSSHAPQTAVARSVAIVSSEPGGGCVQCCISTTAIFVVLPSKAFLKVQAVKSIDYNIF